MQSAILELKQQIKEKIQNKLISKEELALLFAELLEPELDTSAQDFEIVGKITYFNNPNYADSTDPNTLPKVKISSRRYKKLQALSTDS